MNLDLTKFSEFMRCISIFKDLCNDVDIREGVIRQKTNNELVVFEVDLNSVIGNLNVPISHLKEKLDLFRIFIGQNVSIENNTTTFQFSDMYSSLTIKVPDKDFIDNKFISAEDLNNVMSTNREDLILSTPIIPIISERIKVVTMGFHVENVQVAFTGNEASLTTTTVSKDLDSSFISDIRTEQEIVCKTNLISIPFIIDHDGDILFEMFRNGEDRVLSRFSTTISDININLYTRGKLVFNEEELE